MREEPWLNEREAVAWRGFVRMQARLASELARRLSTESCLSYPDYEVLVALTDVPDGRLRLYELGEELSWEKSRVSHQVTRMVDRGLVTKEPCVSDRRGFWVTITDEGRAAITAAAPNHVAAVRELFIDRLTPTRLGVIARVADVVLQGLDAASAAAEDPPAR